MGNRGKLATEIQRLLGDTVIAAICGGLAGALVGSGLMLWYSAWRVCVLLDLQRGGPAPVAALLRWLGVPPQENILLLFPCVAIGLVTGMAVLVWHRLRARFMTSAREAGSR
jgi:hypothetical protein